MKQTYKVTIGDCKFGKKTTIAIEIKGDLTDSQKLALLEFAHSDGFIQLSSAQRDMDDYPERPQHVGLAYKVTSDGITLTSDPIGVVTNFDTSEQLEMDDLVKDDGEPSEDEKEIMSMRSEAEDEEQTEDGWKSEDVPLTDEIEQRIIMVSVEVLKAFKYQEKSVKKGSIIQVPLDIAQGLDNSGVVKLIVDDGLPF